MSNTKQHPHKNAMSLQSPQLYDGTTHIFELRRGNQHKFIGVAHVQNEGALEYWCLLEGRSLNTNGNKGTVYLQFRKVEADARYDNWNNFVTLTCGVFKSQGYTGSIKLVHTYWSRDSSKDKTVLCTI